MAQERQLSGLHSKRQTELREPHKRRRIVPVLCSKRQSVLYAKLPNVLLGKEQVPHRKH